MSAGQKWAQTEKEYLHSEWTSDTKILLAAEQGLDLSPVREFGF